MEGVRPVDLPGSNPTPSLLRLRYLSRVGLEMSKVLTTSLRGMPRSMASSTFSLRSSEYAFVCIASHDHHLLCNPL